MKVIAQRNAKDEQTVVDLLVPTRLVGDKLNYVIYRKRYRIVKKIHTLTGYLNNQ